MKRILTTLFFAVLLICTVSCKKTNTYMPNFTLAEGYSLEGDRISATVIGEVTLHIRDFLISSDAVTVFKGTSSDQYVQGLDAQIPLTFGKNRMVIRFSNGTNEKEYDLEINCIPIQSFTVTVNKPEKTYHIGERFDKSTITVMAIAEDGSEFEVTQYQPEYEFSSIGKSTVSIELDGHCKSFSVMVTNEYQPTLDVSNSADGVFYLITDTEAILLDAKSKEGFFAIPETVIANGQEYPVTEIADNAFTSSWITGLQIPESVHRIGREAFYECLALEWVEMPTEMNEIGERAFYGCQALTRIEIPEGITELKSATFRNCKALEHVTLPKSLQVIADRAFRECSALPAIQFPKNLTEIGNEAFHSCKNLSTVTVENLKRLGNNAFAYCLELESFCIGNVETVGTDIFAESKKVAVYAPQSSAILETAVSDGAKNTVGIRDGEHYIVSLPIEFAIEDGYPYHETLILYLSEGKMHALSDYTVEYPKDSCGYLEASIREGDFSHTFTIFISYTEEIAFDTDSRGVLYHLDSLTGKATLLQAPEWVRASSIYQPETDGLFLVPTTLWRENKMYVVVSVEDDAFEQTKNVEKIFIPILTKES